jgi:hypothetical protein
MAIKLEILHRYWFEFARPELSDQGIHLICWPPTECGVTAYSYEDALDLMQHFVFVEKNIPTIEVVIKDVNVEVLLERNKYIRCCSVWRGVWFFSLMYGPFIGSIDSF